MQAHMRDGDTDVDVYDDLAPGDSDSDSAPARARPKGGEAFGTMAGDLSDGVRPSSRTIFFRVTLTLTLTLLTPWLLTPWITHGQGSESELDSGSLGSDGSLDEDDEDDDLPSGDDASDNDF